MYSPKIYIAALIELSMEYKNTVSVCLSSCNTVSYIALSVMCIYVIYKCLS